MKTNLIRLIVTLYFTSLYANLSAQQKSSIYNPLNYRTRRYDIIIDSTNSKPFTIAKTDTTVFFSNYTFNRHIANTLSNLIIGKSSFPTNNKYWLASADFHIHVVSAYLPGVYLTKSTPHAISGCAAASLS